METDNMGISVVIRCCNDYRIFDCIESIDEDVEIVVSICHTENIRKELEKRNITTVSSPHGNLSITSNNGIASASNKNIILIDSDILFKPGTIQKVVKLFSEFDVINLRIDYYGNTESPGSQLVANTREYINRMDFIFTPGVALKKSIKSDIGGYFFNEKVKFAVDAEFNHRIKSNQIPYVHDNIAQIIHNFVNVSHDLRSARRIGHGCRVGEQELKKYYRDKSYPSNSINLKAFKWQMYPDLISKYGFKTAIYQLLWDINFYWGYYQF